MTSTGRTAAELSVITRIGVGAALAGALSLALLYALDVYALNRSVTLLDLEEGAAVTWASSSATVAVAVLATLLAIVEPSHRRRGLGVGVATAFLSFDDTAFIHERLSYRLADALDVSTSFVQVIWPALYFPLLLALAVMLFGLARKTAAAHRLVVAGLGLLAGAVVLEVAAHGLARTDLDADSVPWVLEIAVEEGAELAGWTLIATGVAVRLVAYLEDRDGGQLHRTAQP